MAEIVLFHHALGLTPGVAAFADGFRDAGHRVHTPDLYEGLTFPDIDSGVAHAEQVGFMTVLERGVAAAQDLPADLVYVGMSLGVLPAQKLAQTRPGARAAVLLHSCVPYTEFGPEWPAGVPAHVHGMDDDPIFAGEGDLDAARELAAASPDAELFVYPGSAHLFTDRGLPDYDADCATLVIQRTLRLLKELD